MIFSNKEKQPISLAEQMAKQTKETLTLKKEALRRAYYPTLISEMEARATMGYSSLYKRYPTREYDSLQLLAEALRADGFEVSFACDVNTFAMTIQWKEKD